MTCTHTDRPNVLSLPSLGNPFMCRQCFDSLNLPIIPAERRGYEYEYNMRGFSVVDGEPYFHQVSK